MAVATKTARTLVAAGTSNAAGGTTTSTTWDLHTALGGLLTLKITNGATGPTVGCQAKVYTSSDNVNFKLRRTLTGTVGANDVNEWDDDLPPGVMYAQVVFSGNTGQAVTVEAFGQELTSIG